MYIAKQDTGLTVTSVWNDSKASLMVAYLSAVGNHRELCAEYADSDLSFVTDACKQTICKQK